MGRPLQRKVRRPPLDTCRNSGITSRQTAIVFIDAFYAIIVRDLTTKSRCNGYRLTKPLWRSATSTVTLAPSRRTTLTLHWNEGGVTTIKGALIAASERCLPLAISKSTFRGRKSNDFHCGLTSLKSRQTLDLKAWVRPRRTHDMRVRWHVKLEGMHRAFSTCQ
jgi:hypothetical protein